MHQVDGDPLILRHPPARRSGPIETDGVRGGDKCPDPCGQAAADAIQARALAVLDAAGHAVWTRKPAAVVCPMLIRLLMPGESMSAKVDWQSPNVATGAYAVQAASGPDLGRSYFTVC